MRIAKTIDLRHIGIFRQDMDGHERIRAAERTVCNLTDIIRHEKLFDIAAACKRIGRNTHDLLTVVSGGCAKNLLILSFFGKADDIGTEIGYLINEIYFIFVIFVYDILTLLRNLGRIGNLDIHVFRTDEGCKIERKLSCVQYGTCAVQMEIAIEEISRRIDHIIGITEHFTIKFFIQKRNVILKVFQFKTGSKRVFIHRTSGKIHRCPFFLRIFDIFIDVCNKIRRDHIGAEIDLHTRIHAARHRIVILIAIITNKAEIVKGIRAVDARRRANVHSMIFRLGCGKFPEAAEHRGNILGIEIAKQREMSVCCLPHRFRIEIKRPCLCIHFGRDNNDIALSNGVLGIIQHHLCAKRRIKTEIDHGFSERFGKKLSIQPKGKRAAANKYNFLALRLIESFHLIIEFSEKRLLKSRREAENDRADRNDGKRKYQQKRKKAYPCFFHILLSAFSLRKEKARKKKRNIGSSCSVLYRF